jgi:hypothetical protein
LNSPIVLSGVQYRILDALAKYRMLTVGLMQRAGVGRDVKHLREALRALERLGLVHIKPWGFTAGAGRNPSLHMLTPKGAKVLAEVNGEDIPVKAPRNVTTAVQHIPHWLGVIEWQIALRTWAESEGVSVDWVQTEFERTDALKRATTLEMDGLRYIPDAIAQITPPDGKARLLVLEYYRANRAHAVKQLEGLKAAASSAIVETHFNSPRRARFVVVFDTGELRDKVLSAWPDKSSSDWKGFYLKALDELSYFNAKWRQPSGGTAFLLQTQ